MRSHNIILVVIVALASLMTITEGGSAGGGILTQGIAFFGPFSGAENLAAGSGFVPEGKSSTTMKVLLPAFSIPHAGGGQDENHVIVSGRTHIDGIWVTSGEILPAVSGYDKQAGTLTVHLNAKVPKGKKFYFEFLTFGNFND